MKIVQVPARFYPRRGGIEELVLQSSRELVKRGHSVTVVCADEPAVGDLEVEGIRVIRLPVMATISNTPVTPGLLGTLLSLDWDVLHSHVPHPWAPEMCAIAAFKKKKPLFVTYHNDTVGRGPHRMTAFLYNNTALPFVLSRARKIFMTHRRYLECSSSLRSYRAKSQVIPMGIDMEKFKPQERERPMGPPTVFFLSRLDRFHHYKGLRDLLLAVKALQREFPVQLRVGGDGELLEDYRDQVRRGALQNVVFLGSLSDGELAREYNQCDVFAMPSTSSAHEGFGMVALEAMACGRPVIVTNVAAVSEDVAGQSAGIVVPPRDAEALRGALAKILKDTKLADAMGRRGRDCVEKQGSWADYAARLEREYQTPL